VRSFVLRLQDVATVKSIWPGVWTGLCSMQIPLSWVLCAVLWFCEFKAGLLSCEAILAKSASQSVAMKCTEDLERLTGERSYLHVDLYVSICHACMICMTCMCLRHC
jgi:hypothetical protein